MNKYRAKYTRLLFDFVFKFQFIFPKSICFLATQYHSYSKLIKKVSSKKSNITSASLFESNFNWKGVSFTFFIDNDELKKVNKWKNKMSLRSSNKYTSEMLEPKSFDQDIGWVAIGMVNIDCDTIMDDFNSIYMNSSYLDSAYITVSKYSAGLSIITFYILLNENATKLVKSIKPPKLTEFVELNSFNIFSNKIKTITILNEGEYVKEYIKENMFNVSKEAWRFLSIIKDEMGIKKENSDIYCVSDINIKQSDPYFSNSSSGRVNQSEFILLSKKQSVFNYSLSENKSESFVFDSSFNVENIDMTYMKTCDVNADKDDESIYCSNSQTHLAIVPLLLIRRKIDNLSNAINKLNLYNKKTSMVKLHKKLFDIIHELQLIEGWLLGLKESIYYNLIPGYENTSNEIISTQLNRVLELKGTMKIFYSLSENRIQISNVRYNQIYSIVVFIFVLIQVVLAAMTIDWGKNNAWYSTIITWVKSII